MLKINWTKLLVIIVSYIVASATAYAAGQNIRFERLSLVDGLSQESVLSSYQDSEGFMWFGTQEGLNRFDGYQFTVYSYSSERDNSLSSDWVYDIEETNDGTMLFATRAGLNVFEKSSQSFIAYKAETGVKSTLSNNTVRVLHKDQNGKIWLGTDSGLNQFIPKTGQFIEYRAPEGLATDSYKIYAIAEDIAGGLWIGTEGGVYRFDTVSETVSFTPAQVTELAGLKTSHIRSLLVDSSQKLWIGTYGDGVTVVDLSSSLSDDELKATQPEALKGMVVVDIFESQAKKVWLATDIGLFLWDKADGEFQLIQHDPKDEFSLSGNKIASIFQDRGGVFWIGSYSGLNKWNIATANFSHYRSGNSGEKGLSHNYINTFFDAGDDRIWIGTYEGGLNLFDVATSTAQVFANEENENSLRSDKVMALHARSDNELWIGYRDKGLSRLDRETGTFTHYGASRDDQNSIGSNGITSFEAGEDGTFWVGAFNGGLNLYDPKKDHFVRYHHDKNDPESLSSNKVLSIYRDRAGFLWIGTWDGGLNIFDPITSKARRIQHNAADKESLGANAVWSVLEDKAGNIWVGTQGGGLNLLTADRRRNADFRFKRFTRFDGLPSNVIYGVLEDNDGMLWLSTNRGITKFDPKSFQLLNYDSSHGLQGNEFNSGAFYKSRDGRFFFGGTNGATAFYPSDISPNSHVPPVVVTRFQRLNEIESIEALKRRYGRIEVSHNDYLIAFEFAGLDFASPSNNKYQYKLEGFDLEWIEARDIRKATYTNLPAGNYVFRVKAANNDGVWNEQGADVALTVLPAPWYSWWAYSIYSVLILAVIVWLFRSYQAKLQKEANYRHELEMEVANRTSELSEANERLLNASITDQLTGLHNRRFLSNIVEQQASSVFRDFEKAKKAGEVSAEKGPRLFFLMFDLDGFKPINDTYGHDAGDKVIVQVGELLKEVSRSADTVIRWGGDEFLVMGRIENQSEVDLLAERIRSTIAEYGFDIGLKQKMHLSSSIGFSCFPFSNHYPDSLSWEQVHRIADSALYKSKDAGRNCWTGLMQSDVSPPLNILNTLLQNMDKAISNGHIVVKQQSETVISPLRKR